MDAKQILSDASAASFAECRQMWVWVAGSNYRFGPAIPSGVFIYGRVIADELFRWDGGNYVIENV